jgi:hypothetical protein
MEPGNLMGRKLRARILYATLVAILAVLITLATSFWAPYSMYESGFPFSWETRFCVAILVESPGGFGCSPLTYNWLAFALDMLFYALSAMVCFLAMADIMLVNLLDFRQNRTQKLRRSASKKSRRAVASFLLLFFIGFFLVPIIPVEGTRVFPAGHCPSFAWKWTDWQSVGYHFLGLGYNLRIWIQHDFCQ